MLFARRGRGGTDTERSAAETREEIRAEELLAWLQGEAPPLVLDVRTHAEYTSGCIPGARHIPLTELPHRLVEVPRGQVVVCVCRSGHRSGMACRLLRSHGLDARNLAGGMLRWCGDVARAGA
jgi:rhodanese-related sulfurtransferase